ncbi:MULTISPECIES: helix-turn-helix domain-containing protein [Burkholderia]|uniref:Transcriptional regulator n=1 Tax=Burkholderia savannae TaxID=1637837 RepID=A0ABR5T7R1_9BURK|nr:MULTISPECIES: helix-turn-helix domain-containing protein [Burkholderia]AOJ73090.1 transcriptional regulator [Burkholderia savannae]AOJ85115.1 transcriptional regulator [Burkholderia savannae]AOK51062.1 transcriptional regulator [Burkholderia sp. MSMB617WGS]KGS08503.1 bacterial regulatory, arsR family protein [Burkholderia sp. ABCPW 111]KVG48969.1 transcriptional regulator [Burkholderia sp. MSMB0265]
MSAGTTTTTKSAEKVLEVLNVLLGHFAHGLTPGELAKATRLSPSNITRYVATLEETGFAERIPETGRIRPSVRFAQHAVAIAQSLNAARHRLDELASRLAAPR